MPKAGQLFGDYRLAETLGRGAFGAVWLAHHTRLGHPVAIKFASEVDAERIERFLREARLVAAIKHRHVVEVIDFGTEGGDAFMIMEYVKGRTLAVILDEDVALDARLTVEIVQQLLKATGACHAAGVVHRDIKPDNVFVEFDDDGHVFVKLVDFGISKVVDPEQRRRGRESVIPTHDGRIVGTPEYMSPEAARGDVEIDARADIYSLGAMTYEMLSGRLPFDGPTPSVIVAQVLLGRAKPLAEMRPELPTLAAIVERAMARDPERRFNDVRAMRVALAEAAEADLGMVRESITGRIRLSSPGQLEAERPVARTATVGDAARDFEEPVLARPPRRPFLPRALAGVVLVGGAVAWWWASAEPTGSAEVAQPDPSGEPQSERLEVVEPLAEAGVREPSSAPTMMDPESAPVVSPPPEPPPMMARPMRPRMRATPPADTMTAMTSMATRATMTTTMSGVVRELDF